MFPEDEEIQIQVFDWDALSSDGTTIFPFRFDFCIIATFFLYFG